jgi:hypothetical protein
MLIPLLMILSISVSLLACSPEVGSQRWCENLSEKSKGDWTASEAGSYAKHCLFQ